MDTLESVKDYYGKVLKNSDDLKTSACTCASAHPYQKILSLIEDEIKNKFYGCGSPIPEELEGKTVVDLGCGTGRDVFIMSYLAGESGKVIGVDMTEEQLEVAKKHTDAQMKKFGFSKSNVEFIKGYIEDLSAIADNSVDVVISNCVINLSPDKERVFSEIFRILKVGGELHFSDVFADRRMPKHLKENEVFYGECLGGALYTEDFRRMLAKVGCPDYRITKQAPIDLNGEMKAMGGMINFFSLTVRAFKLENMEDICEDYGQVAIYKGTIADHPHSFELDDHHTFFTSKPKPVCGNTASMLSESRLAKHFSIIGDRSTHFGEFDCSPSPSKEQSNCGC